MTFTCLSLGDSYTIGEGVAAIERWPNQLASELRKRDVDIAEPRIIATTGWTTDELAGAIDREGVHDSFDLVTLLIGVNNQYRGRDPENYRAEFASLLNRAIHFAGGDVRRVIVVSIPDWGVTPFALGRDRARIAAEIDAFNGINCEVTKQAGARYADITAISREGASMVVSDGLHPSAAMYARWTEAILPQAIAVLTSGSAVSDVS
jgi:lysophospholipase L1-like esterase